MNVYISINWIGVRSCLTTKTRQNKTTEHLAGCFSCRFDDLEMLLAMNSYGKSILKRTSKRFVPWLQNESENQDKSTIILRLTSQTSFLLSAMCIKRVFLFGLNHENLAYSRKFIFEFMLYRANPQLTWCFLQPMD